MKWEFLGIQELRTGRGMLQVGVHPPLWRASVPGGWFVVLNVGGHPFFYPDPEHLWDPIEKQGDPNEQMLLRPAMDQTPDE